MTNTPSRRVLLSRATRWLGAGALSLIALCATPAHAADATAPVMKSADIVKALSKDIVIDRVGAGAGVAAPSQSQQPAPEPAVDLQVQFSFDSAVLLPQGKRQLDELAMALGSSALARWSFMLAGHTDRVGDAAYNVRLSQSRADAVRNYLAEVHRIDPERLQTIGYGAARLVDPQHPTAAINRRVEVRRITLVHSLDEAAPAGQLVPTPR